MYKFDYLVFIGRFQPFHLAHMQTIEIALQQSHYVVLALGSAQMERNIKNPFLAIEREQMILSNFSLDEQKRIKFVHVVDVYNDEKWVKQVKSLVNGVIEPNSKVGLIGHFKDESSYYLKLFPEWIMVELDSLKDSISATPMREAYYRGEIQTEFFPVGTIQFLDEFQKTRIYQQLQQRFEEDDLSNLDEFE
ncbi:nicotinate-nicotinamide nucleotide adenylyltransferase [Acinetobacter calcoaceticus]|jgi:bifunctional NMN adenylyltransferase/nudix hydrolase|uniref:nicotinate-nicotinamide nucleotide adenylyltransferase n=1 Tax=Acinetobacter TaxID=469 RepID=UPI0009ACD82A|nr:MULTISPECIES: nicotinate-nicotinamide nucleotide adenylyltransferase [Acinetobacter]AQZ83866.1 nicotinamide-nucleotide adenylyltransferase [Acinetobacter calcoaceticus]MBP2604180.1 bifunctional NMN adenylyltransferase/nudix hydrolase [Acinetobacter calcoaceticus]MDS7933460.1 nicotinate-nicotinamide nucleotide adenylyltransferase [Acinetobacter sp. V91_4B]MDS7965064.1 nicotinate-nicotinamide nucleotide adenylyltransferase [Acinetobacter sp. V91_7]MDS8027729.1 nicotinate-nicotinamide nucleoti